MNLRAVAAAVLAVQVVLLSTILVRLMGLEAELARVAADVDRAASGEPARAATLSFQERDQLLAAVRDAVRLELAASPQQASASRARPPQVAAAEAVQPQRTPEAQVSPSEATQIVADVRRDIQSFSAGGAMTEADFAALQARIASLPPEERSAALSMLSRAISSGEIDARF